MYSDGDGLADAWEERNFTNLTARSGPLDFDGDGLSDADEHQAGTDPKDPASKLEIRNEAFDSTPEAFRFQWPSASNRLYTVRRAINLKADFETMATDVSATPPFKTYVDPTATSTNRYYYLIYAQPYP